jgi:hypothetical protein
VKFLLHRGFSIPSPAALNQAHDRLVAQLDSVVASSGVPVVRFKPGDCKEDIARPFQDEAAAAGRPGLVLVGKAQERTSSWRGFVDASHAQPPAPAPPHLLAASVLGARPLVLLMRREAPFRIPGAAGRNSEGGSWA